MEKTVTLEEALKRIEELEKENAHNAKWMAIYNDFVVGYESGMTMVEIADDFFDRKLMEEFYGRR